MGIVDILKPILSYYRDVNIQTELGITPLILAAREGHTQCVKLLLCYGAKLEICDKLNSMTAIHYSAKNGHFKCLLALTEHYAQHYPRGASLNVVNMLDRQHRTALMLAVSGKGAYFDCVQQLLVHEADPNIVDTDNHSCLFRAVSGSRPP